MVDPRNIVGDVSNPVVDLTVDSDSSVSSLKPHPLERRKRKRKISQPSTPTLTKVASSNSRRTDSSSFRRSTGSADGSKANPVPLDDDDDQGDRSDSSHAKESRVGPEESSASSVHQGKNKATLDSPQLREKEEPPGANLSSEISAFTLIVEMTGLRKEFTDRKRRALEYLWRKGELADCDGLRNAVFKRLYGPGKVSKKFIKAYRTLLQQGRIPAAPTTEFPNFICIQPRTSVAPTESRDSSRDSGERSSASDEHSAVTNGQKSTLNIRGKRQTSDQSFERSESPVDEPRDDIVMDDTPGRRKSKHRSVPKKSPRRPRDLSAEDAVLIDAERAEDNSEEETRKAMGADTTSSTPKGDTFQEPATYANPNPDEITSDPVKHPRASKPASDTSHARKIDSNSILRQKSKHVNAKPTSDKQSLSRSSSGPFVDRQKPRKADISQTHSVSDAASVPSTKDVIAKITQDANEAITMGPPKLPAEPVAAQENDDPQSMEVTEASGLSTFQPEPVPLSLLAVEAVLRRYVKELHDDHEQIMKVWLPRARKCYQRGEPQVELPSKRLERGNSTVPLHLLQKESPFASMKPIQVPTQSGEPRSLVKLHQEVFTERTNKGAKSFISVPVTKYKSEAVTVPAYNNYVSLKQNVLAGNNRELLVWPYFGEEAHEDKSKKSLWQELGERFDMVTDRRPQQVLRNEQSHKFGPYAQAFLEEIGCTINDVLRYLLEPEPGFESLLKVEMPLAEVQAWKTRGTSCKEVFNRSKKRWILVLSALPASNDRALALAGLACSVFLKVCGFSLWHIAKKSEIVEATLKAMQNARADRQLATYRSMACRVCHLHNCPFHGEIREEADSDSDKESLRHGRSRANSGSSSGSISGLEESYNINHKYHVNTEPREHLESVNGITTNNDLLQQPKRSINYWLQKSKTHLHQDRAPFYPCSHEGSCEEAQCRCFREQITCEKTCACPPSCKRRFRGCTCAQTGKVCWQNQRCDCFLLNRECDADLCGTCGAAEVLDPVNRYSEVAGKCANVYIQRNLPKRTIAGKSEVQGFGLYMGEKAKANDYLGEYKGEILTNGEADRRGTIYHHQRTNYLFKLNREQEVDATNAGNKFRFINNSELDSIINCYSKVMLCNTVTRIGMYAKRDIDVGEELFFNYGYPKEVTKNFWEKGQTTARGANFSAGKAVAVKTKADKPPRREKRGVARPAGKKGKSRAVETLAPRVASASAAASAASPARPSRLRAARAAASALAGTADEGDVQAAFGGDVEMEEDGDEGVDDGEYDEFEVPPSSEEEEEAVEESESEYESEEVEEEPVRRSGRQRRVVRGRD